MALDEGRARSGPGYDELESIVSELFAGDTQHAGALLGPFGVRFLIAAEGDLPPGAEARLSAQVDLDLVPAGGLTIFRNAAVLPTAFVSENAPVPRASDPTALEDASAVDAEPLDGGGDRFSGTATSAGHVVVSAQFDDGWRVRNDDRSPAPFEGYGWAIAARVEPGAVIVEHPRPWYRTAELVALALLWIGALWITRKPGSA